MKHLKLSPCSLRLCGVSVPPKRVKSWLHVSALTLFLVDLAAGLILAHYLPQAIHAAAGSGSKVAAVLESIALFIEDAPHP